MAKVRRRQRRRNYVAIHGAEFVRSREFEPSHEDPACWHPIGLPGVPGILGFSPTIIRGVDFGPVESAVRIDMLGQETCRLYLRDGEYRIVDAYDIRRIRELCHTLRLKDSGDDKFGKVPSVA